jgi:hypothetical protein
MRRSSWLRVVAMRKLRGLCAQSKSDEHELMMREWTKVAEFVVFSPLHLINTLSSNATISANDATSFKSVFLSKIVEE